MTLAELNVQIGGKIERLEQSIAQATALVEAYGRKTAQQLSVVNKQLAEGSAKAAATTSAAMKKAADAAENVGASSTKSAASVESAFGRANTALQQFGGALGSIGSTLTTHVTVPLALAAGASVKFSTDFGDAMAKIEGAAGAGAAEVGRLRDQVLSLAGETGKAPKELADAMYYIESMGFRGAEAMDILTRSAKASEAGLGTVADVASTVKYAVNAYGKENLDAARATDILAAATREGGAAPDAFAGAIGRVLPMAALMHVSFDKLAGSIAAMTRIGLHVPEAVTAIRQIFATLLHPSSQVDEALADIGLTAKGVAKAMSQDLLGTLAELDKRSEKAGASLAAAFPNIRAFAGVSSLLGENAANTAGILDRVSQATGSLDTMFGAMSKTTGHDMRVAFAELQAAAIRAGDTMAPVIKEIAAEIKGAAEAFERLTPETQKFVLEVGLGLAVMGPFARGLSNMISLGSTLKTVFVSAAEGIAALRAAQAVSATGGAGAAVAGVGAAATTAKTAAASGSFLSGLLGPSAEEVAALAAAETTAAAGATGLTAALAASIPVVGQVAAAIVALVGLHEAFKSKDEEVAKSISLTNEQFKQHVEAQQSASRAAMDGARSLVSLIDRHDVLAAKTARTKQEDAELQSIMNRIADSSAGLVTGYDAQGNAIGVIGNAADIAAGKLRALLQAEQEAAHGLAEIVRQATSIPTGFGITGPNAKLGAVAEIDKQIRQYENIVKTGRRDGSKAPMFAPAGDFMVADVAAANRKLRELHAERAKIERESKATISAIWHSGDPAQPKAPLNLGGGGGAGGDGGGKSKVSDVEREMQDLVQKAYEARKAMDLGPDATEHAKLWYDGWHGAIEGVRTEATRVFGVIIPGLYHLAGPNVDAFKHAVNVMDAQERDAAKRKSNADFTKNALSASDDFINQAAEDAQKRAKFEEDIVRKHVDEMISIIQNGDARITALRKQIELDGIDTEVSKVAWDLLNTSLSQLPDDMKAELLGNAAAIDKRNAIKAANQDLDDAFQKFYEDQVKEMDKIFDQWDEYAKAIQETDDRLADLNGRTKEQKMLQEALRQFADLPEEKVQALVDTKLYFDDLEEFQKKAEEVAGKITEVMASAGEALFTEGFKPAFNSIYDGFRKLLSDMVLEWAKAQAQMAIKDAILGSSGGGGVLGVLQGMIGLNKPQEGGGGSVFGAIKGAIGSLGGGSGDESPEASLSSLVSGFLADGGPTFAGKAYIVGERGPELFVPNSAGAVVPMASGGGSTAVHIHIYGDPKTGGLNLTEAQIATAAQRGLDQARRSGLR